MSKKLIKRVNKQFESQFGSIPLMVFSPGRINLIGEHTDYNEGFVFPAAINKGIALAIQRNNKSKSQVYAIDKKEIYEFDLENIQPLKNGTWRNYVLGVVAGIHYLDKKIENFNIAFTGNIPGGAGMSSSAALENSVVFALNELFNLGLSKHQMITISQNAEHDFVGVQCGIMDQYASMYGIDQKALLLDCRTLTSQSYTVNLKKHQFILINTHVKHNLPESAYNDRRHVCKNISEKLNKRSLRDACKKDLQTIRNDISEEDYQKALYVIEENKRVEKFAKTLQNNDVEELGKLLYQSHNGLSSQYKVSCKELDFLVDKAKKSPAFLGARMMGGGFGGCTINLIKKRSKKSINKIIKEYELKFDIKPSVYKIKLKGGVKKITL